MYNKIYSIVNDFIKAVEQDKNLAVVLKASNKAFPVMTLFMRILLLQNQMRNESGLHFIDSTPVSTCLNRRIFSHKVSKGFASRGKSTKGWFYGFKLHGVCSENGMLGRFHGRKHQ